MKFQELKNRVIHKLSWHGWDTLESDINKCRSWVELVKVLENEYGFDKQGSLHIIFSSIIDDI